MLTLLPASLLILRVLVFLRNRPLRTLANTEFRSIARLMSLVSPRRASE